MAFLVYDSAHAAPTEYGDRASYSFNQAGFLVVLTEDGTRQTFAPHAWHHIEDRPKSGGSIF